MSNIATPFSSDELDLLRALHRRRVALKDFPAKVSGSLVERGLANSVLLRGRDMLELSEKGIGVAESKYGPIRRGNVGGARIGAGHKTIVGDGKCARLQVTLDDETASFLSGVGGGNLSLGIRLAGAHMRDGYFWVSQSLSAALIDELEVASFAEARAMKHSRVRIEHLLLACGKVNGAVIALPSCVARTFFFSALSESLSAWVPDPIDADLVADARYLALIDHLRAGKGLVAFFCLAQGQGTAADLLRTYGFLPAEG